MKFSIDVAFLAGDRTVVRVARLKPWRSPWAARTARSAVEAEAGALERWGVRVGDQLEVREVPSSAVKRRAVTETRRGQLVLVATPIGNLGDLSPRACAVLESADLICCEDTRRTRALLSAAGIPAGGPRGDRLLSLHGHNEEARLGARCCRGRRWRHRGGGQRRREPRASRTLVPGWRHSWPRRARSSAPCPGPSSVLGALVVSGLAL